MGESILKDKSYAFALRSIKLYKFLKAEKTEFVISKQVLKSGTAIGALIREAQFGESRPDFVHKMSIALKEANETDYWLCLLKDSDYNDEKVFTSIQKDIQELIAMLVSTIKTIKKNR